MNDLLYFSSSLFTKGTDRSIKMNPLVLKLRRVKVKNTGAVSNFLLENMTLYYFFGIPIYRR